MTPLYDGFLRPTPLYDGFWRFTEERQRIMWAKLAGAAPPYTDDPTLRDFKFTCPYVCCDKISQYLLRIIYDGVERTADAMFARIILFKVFNTEAGWRLIEPYITLTGIDWDGIDGVLTQAIEGKVTFWSAAYMMHAPHGAGEPKHRPYLRLVQQMLADGLPEKLAADIDEVGVAAGYLSEYKMIGDFIGYQWAQFLSYAPQFDFNDGLPVAGPGTLRGFKKMFTDLRNIDGVHLAMWWLQQNQEAEFARLGLTFRTIGRPLWLCDIANLCCEYDKYTRASNPTGDGKRIKQKFRPNSEPINLMFPPKWALETK
jgi:hypothetical protein